MRTPYAMPQGFLGFRAETDGYCPEPPTVTPPPQLYTRGPALEGPARKRAYADGTAIAVAGLARMFVGSVDSPVVTANGMYYPQYTPISRMADQAYSATHRTVDNLFHPPAPTAAAAPRPDWNPFAGIRTWPNRAVAGIRQTVFGQPQGPSLKGRV